MELFADPITVNCRKVLAGLQMMDADYTLTKVDYFKGEQKNDEFKSINPNAALPALKDGDLVLWESNAILQYVADTMDKTEFYPKDPTAHSGIFHCFSGDQELADAALEMGFYISFSGSVTFKKADDLREVAKNVPADRLFAETDCPYLMPRTIRPRPKTRRNEPANLPWVRDSVAAARGVSAGARGVRDARP